MDTLLKENVGLLDAGVLSPAAAGLGCPCPRFWNRPPPVLCAPPGTAPVDDLSGLNTEDVDDSFFFGSCVAPNNEPVVPPPKLNPPDFGWPPKRDDAWLEPVAPGAPPNAEPLASLEPAPKVPKALALGAEDVPAGAPNALLVPSAACPNEFAVVLFSAGGAPKEKVGLLSDMMDVFVTIGSD